MGLALASGGSVLELAGIGSIGHGGSFQQLLTGSTSVAHLLPKACHANPVQIVSKMLFIKCFTAFILIFLVEVFDPVKT